MFPTIFTLGIKGSGPLTEEGSGLLIMAIAGGALVIVQGWLADRYGLQMSFLLTAACELYVLFYASVGEQADGIDRAAAAALGLNLRVRTGWELRRQPGEARGRERNKSWKLDGYRRSPA